MVEAFEYITTVDLNLGSRYSPIKMASLTLHDEVKHKWLFNCHVGLPSWACLTKQEQHHPRGRAGRASSILCRQRCQQRNGDHQNGLPGSPWEFCSIRHAVKLETDVGLSEIGYL